MEQKYIHENYSSASDIKLEVAMKQKTSILIILVLWSIGIYAQEETFSAKVYYSSANEIAVEIQNLIDDEMVILVDRGSYMNLYDVSGQYESGQLVNHPLKATDSLNILIKIPPHKIYIAKYKVKDKALAKVYLKMEYSHHFSSPPASVKWEKYSQETDILVFDRLRTPIKKNQIVKKEKLSGDYVYSSPEVMPEFPGGLRELWKFLNLETYDYSYETGDQAYIRIRVVIEKDGSISHPYLIMGKDPYFQKAALEVIKRMPKWKPGVKDGKAVRTFDIIPIFFKLV